MRPVIVMGLTLLVFAGSAAGTPRSPSIFRSCVGCPEMVRLPGGSFTIGSPASDHDSDSTERPQRVIAIRPFAIGRYDVTRSEYARFVHATHRRTEYGCSWIGKARDEPDLKASWDSPGFAQTSRHPVICITFEDANAYVDWLRTTTGKPYRLPSEAEWEYAARAGTTSRYPWGDHASRAFANYGNAHFGDGATGGRDRWILTSPTGAFPPNRFGLFDMNGNVLQMVADCYSPDYSRTPTDGSPYLVNEKIANAPIKEIDGTDSCTFHMLRGGDWGDPGSVIRSAMRNFGPVPWSIRSGGVGFRVAMSLN